MAAAWKCLVELVLARATEQWRFSGASGHSDAVRSALETELTRDPALRRLVTTPRMSTEEPDEPEPDEPTEPTALWTPRQG